MGTHPIFESDFDCLTDMVGITEQFNLLPESKKERYTVTIPEGSWTSNKDFTVEDGEKDIENFVKKWEIDEAWLFCIDYFGKEDGEFDTKHHSNVRNGSSPIGVEYQVEGSRLNQSPGKLAFRQQWLYDVLKSKNTFLELVNFQKIF